MITSLFIKQRHPSHRIRALDPLLRTRQVVHRLQAAAARQRRDLVARARRHLELVPHRAALAVAVLERPGRRDVPVRGHGPGRPVRDGGAARAHRQGLAVAAERRLEPRRLVLRAGLLDVVVLSRDVRVANAGRAGAVDWHFFTGGSSSGGARRGAFK